MSEEIRFSRKHERIFVVALGLGGLVSAFNSTNIYIALPTIMQYFNVDMATMQLAIVGFLVMNCLVIPASGYLTDRFSGKKMFFFGYNHSADFINCLYGRTKLFDIGNWAFNARCCQRAFNYGTYGLNLSAYFISTAVVGNCSYQFY